MRNLVKISSNVYALRFPNTPKREAALVTIGTNTEDVAFSGGVGSKKKGEHIPRGLKDVVLFDMHKLASESPNKWRLIKTRRDFVVGLGVYCFKIKEDFQTRKPTEIEVINNSFNEFKKRVGFDDVFSSSALQQAFGNDVFIKITLGLDKKIESYEVIDCFHIRIRTPTDGERTIKEYVINPNFGTKRFKPVESITFPAFDEKNPIAYAVAIIHLRDKLPGQEFYQIGDWWGTEEWANVANKIPKFHDSGLDNGYNIKYHISIPDNYFQKEGLNEEEQEKLKEDTLDAMGDSLSGIENVDKVLYTFHGIDGQGRDRKSVV